MTRSAKNQKLEVFIRDSFSSSRNVPASPLEPAWQRVLERSRNGSNDESEELPADIHRVSHRLLFVAAGVTLLILISVSVLLNNTFRTHPETIADQSTTHRIRAHEVVRADQRGALLSLADGSTIEMRPQSELLTESAQDGVTIQLKRGAVIMNVVKPQRGHLYVQTEHFEITVTGTVFLVAVEPEGSRVGVIEGEVLVRSGKSQKKLHTGEQEKTSPVMTTKPLREEIAWSRGAEAYLQLLEESLSVKSVPSPIVTSPKQGAPKVSFEVSSVRPTAPDRLNQLRYEKCKGGGRFIASGVPLMWIIRFGFRVQDREVIGAPDWTNAFDKGFDIEAKPEGPVTEEKCRSMVRSLLEERFHLRTHRETREASVYALVRGTGKLKLREVSEDGPVGGVRINGAVMQAVSEGQAPAGWPVSTLIGYISGFTGRRVIDKTGLRGLYAFSLDFAINEGDTRQGVFRAVQEQLGLKLESSKEKVEFLIIDGVDKPTEN